MILAVLGLIDVIAGILLFLESAAPGSYVTWVGFLVLLKAAYSIVTSIASKFYFDIFGIIDLITAFLMLTAFYVPFFWLLPLLKGIYSIFVGFAR